MTSSEKIKILPSVTHKIAPISGYITCCKAAARVLQYLKISLRLLFAQRSYSEIFFKLRETITYDLLLQNPKTFHSFKKIDQFLKALT